MSSRELAYSILDKLSEEKLQAFITLFGDESAGVSQAKKSASSLCGIFHDAADPSLAPQEKRAWEQAAAEKFLAKAEEEEEA